MTRVAFAPEKYFSEDSVLETGDSLFFVFLPTQGCRIGGNLSRTDIVVHDFEGYCLMSQSYDALPAYLKKYCSVQDYGKYTDRDHAAWRYIMRQNLTFFSDYGVPVYKKGLRQTGIPLDRIPSIEEMDKALSVFGWGAVPVCGFIPPAAFLEFQARGCLPIATDMRTLEHICYTPAPDIVHEAAGHAPIIADPEYASYLKQYAAMAQKAIISSEDIDLYEAIRILSDIKENPDSSPHDILKAEEGLVAATKNMSYSSEAAEVARMAWWTVEYGLLGDLKKPKIYGAGLLSSVGESQNCLSDEVKKVPLSLECIRTSYDITKPQPQLFVAKSMQQLKDILEDYERTMAHRIGGKIGLDRTIQAKNVNTIGLESSIEISGQVVAYETDERGKPCFVKLQGPSQICYEGKELSGQGRLRHPQGFSSPIGRWLGVPDKSPHLLTEDELRRAGISAGEHATIKFTSGFVVEGVLQATERRDGKLILMTLEPCSVKRQGKLYYDPEWGPFDMVVGENVTTVYGGPASKEEFGSYHVGISTTSPGRTSPYSDQELRNFKLYRKIRDLRSIFETGKLSENFDVTLTQLASDSENLQDSDWLTRVEILEMAEWRKRETGTLPRWAEELLTNLTQESRQGNEQQGRAIERALAIAHIQTVS